MITQETAASIWSAYREIEASEKLLADMAAVRSEPFRERDRHAPTLKDAFGRVRHLQLGIPSGENGHRIFDVAPELAESVIRAHIARKRVELTEANERARIELSCSNIVVSGGDPSADRRTEDGLVGNPSCPLRVCKKCGVATRKTFCHECGASVLYHVTFDSQGMHESDAKARREFLAASAGKLEGVVGTYEVPK